MLIFFVVAFPYDNTLAGITSNVPWPSQPVQALNFVGNTFVKNPPPPQEDQLVAALQAQLTVREASNISAGAVEAFLASVGSFYTRRKDACSKCISAVLAMHKLSR